MTRRDALILIALTLLGLGLRLLVWRWREFYELGGDEREYFEQALVLLRGQGYRELQLMRPPLYTVFLAVVFQLFDSQVQRVRLVQALISSATIPLFWLFTRELLWGYRRRGAVALLAAALAACCYTLAANATELLTETLFVGGLVPALWLVLLAARLQQARIAALAGLLIGVLCLLRSVALPLVPLAAAYLLASSFGPHPRPLLPRLPQARGAGSPSPVRQHGRGGWGVRAVRCSVFLVLGSLLIIAPWTLRNYVRYDALIVVDTTGAENLWLDNNPAGREAAKQQLYALGEDRGLRQRLSLERGREAIIGDLPGFAAKAWSEARKFVALEYFDDLRQRRAIWVRPPDVWLRLLLGDALWLLVLCGGSAGLWLARLDRAGRADPRWLLVPWALYVFLTGLLFHVELRYRLPLYPVLVPFCAYAINVVTMRRWRVRNAGTSWGTPPHPRPHARGADARGADARGADASVGPTAVPSITQVIAEPLLVSSSSPLSVSPSRRLSFSLRALAACLTVALITGLLLAHRGYIGESAMLARKHWQLRQAHAAILSGQPAPAHLSAERALALDPESALARVYLGRSASGDEALAWWREAIEVLPAHPYAHLLLGDALRGAGQDEAARAELAYEASSLEDLQRWSRRMFRYSPAAGLDVGGGLDLGAIEGFHAAYDGARWTGRRSEIHLLPESSSASLRLRSPRPPGARPAQLEVLVAGELKARAIIGPEWQELDVPLDGASTPVVLTLSSGTFRPRDYNRADGDIRELGVEVDWIR